MKPYTKALLMFFVFLCVLMAIVAMGKHWNVHENVVAIAVAIETVLWVISVIYTFTPEDK